MCVQTWMARKGLWRRYLLKPFPEVVSFLKCYLLVLVTINVKILRSKACVIYSLLQDTRLYVNVSFRPHSLLVTFLFTVSLHSTHSDYLCRRKTGRSIRRKTLFAHEPIRDRSQVAAQASQCNSGHPCHPQYIWAVLMKYLFYRSDVNECRVNNPCTAGATCVNTIGSYICYCLPGWKGLNCDEGMEVLVV